MADPLFEGLLEVTVGRSVAVVDAAARDGTAVVVGTGTWDVLSEAVERRGEADDGSDLVVEE